MFNAPAAHHLKAPTASTAKDGMTHRLSFQAIFTFTCARCCAKSRRHRLLLFGASAAASYSYAPFFHNKYPTSPTRPRTTTRDRQWQARRSTRVAALLSRPHQPRVTMTLLLMLLSRTRPSMAPARPSMATAFASMTKLSVSIILLITWVSWIPTCDLSLI
jgi:hypothetical protein